MSSYHATLLCDPSPCILLNSQDGIVVHVSESLILPKLLCLSGSYIISKVFSVSGIIYDTNIRVGKKAFM